jgi:hypothetical protein
MIRVEPANPAQSAQAVVADPLGDYHLLRQPLCAAFVDAVHRDATDLIRRSGQEDPREGTPTTQGTRTRTETGPGFVMRFRILKSFHSRQDPPSSVFNQSSRSVFSDCFFSAHIIKQPLRLDALRSPFDPLAGPGGDDPSAGTPHCLNRSSDIESLLTYGFALRYSPQLNYIPLCLG